eukprot:CAMPEP_0201095454 /NCGR_PEP_ID=MMETSP0812-20130820/4187_1 /ASSEMBLY_ACC=CAM_ASM_000668 /TAXON_ID=98059 /ORGANISM="Dinobryon sp., Strain UTEXLB2267" /LENGTH=186 /DNA_ID=CAMNT_0047348963 /DNA_START=486 /DNA_END=1046 /DNA_ORIENTATION=+
MVADINPKNRTIISAMGDEEVETTWITHEALIRKCLLKREEMNNEAAAQLTNSGGKSSFQSFWRDKCRFWAILALFFFYFGTLFLVVAIIIFMWAQFYLIYGNYASAVVAAALICLAIGVGIFALVVFHWQDGKRLFKKEDASPIENTSGKSTENNAVDVEAANSLSISIHETGEDEEFKISKHDD